MKMINPLKKGDIMMSKIKNSIKNNCYLEAKKNCKDLKMQKLRILVAGPHRSGKSSFIQTFIHYNFDYQKVK